MTAYHANIQASNGDADAHDWLYLDIIEAFHPEDRATGTKYLKFLTACIASADPAYQSSMICFELSSLHPGYAPEPVGRSARFDYVKVLELSHKALGIPILKA